MMKKLNILFVFGFPIQIGGHFKSALAMAKNLGSMGHQIYMASPGGIEEKIQEFLSIGAQHFPIPELIKVHRFPSASGALKIMRICRKHSIDIIHSQDFNSIAPSYLASIILKKGCIYTKAGGPAERTAVFPPLKIKSIFYSQELIDGMMKRYDLIESNITLIRARIDMTVYKPCEIDKDFLAKYNLPDSRKKIVMAIRLNYSKMPWINNLFQFARQISTKKTGIKIIIAGEGPDFFSLKEQAAAINLQSNEGSIIHLIGPILKADEICKLYNYADIVAGNGRGILEAMACKKPVIVLGENGEGELVTASNINETAEFNFSGRHFRHKKMISSTLAYLLEGLVENEEELRSASSFSYEYIKNYMDAAIGAKQLLEVYNKPIVDKNSFLDYFIWNTKAIYDSLKTSIKNRLSLRKKSIPR